MRLEVPKANRLRKGHRETVHIIGKEKVMLLAFEVVLFGGLAFMFFCILRNQDAMLQNMREEHAAILSVLAKLERRIATLQQLEASIAVNPLAKQPCPQESEPASAPEPGTWSRATTPAAEPRPLEPCSPLDGLSLDPPSSLGYDDDDRPRGGMPDLKI